MQIALRVSKSGLKYLSSEATLEMSPRRSKRMPCPTINNITDIFCAKVCPVGPVLCIQCAMFKTRARKRTSALPCQTKEIISLARGEIGHVHRGYR